MKYLEKIEERKAQLIETVQTFIAQYDSDDECIRDRCPHPVIPCARCLAEVIVKEVL